MIMSLYQKSMTIKHVPPTKVQKYDKAKNPVEQIAQTKTSPDTIYCGQVAKY